MSWISLETHAGETIHAGQRKLTIFSKVLRLDIPGIYGGWIWNRPTAVLVTDSDGQERLLPVHDSTMQAVWLIIVTGLLGGLIIWLAFNSKKKVVNNNTSGGPGDE